MYVELRSTLFHKSSRQLCETFNFQECPEECPDLPGPGSRIGIEPLQLKVLLMLFDYTTELTLIPLAVWRLAIER